MHGPTERNDTWVMADNLVVSTKNGKVRGIKQKSNFSGASYYAFYGVPYGQPPVDNLRFKVIAEEIKSKNMYSHTKHPIHAYSFLAGSSEGEFMEINSWRHYTTRWLYTIFDAVLQHLRLGGLPVRECLYTWSRYAVKVSNNRKPHK